MLTSDSLHFCMSSYPRKPPLCMSCNQRRSVYTAGQAAVKQFLGTRPPETKTAQPSPTSYSNFPILGGQPVAPVPAPASATLGLSPVRQSGAVPPTNVSACHFTPPWRLQVLLRHSITAVWICRHLCLLACQQEQTVQIHSLTSLAQPA